MEIENLIFEGLKIIHLKKFNDQRGSFIKNFSYDFFAENGLATDFRENYFSISNQNIIRGMHFQEPPNDHTKLVYIIQGSILDITLDLRKNSFSYGKFFQTTLNVNSPFLIYIPKGFAHGFLSLEANTIVGYMQTTTYNSESDKGILFNSFGFEWPIDNPILSLRDLNFPKFSDYNSKF